MEYQVRQPINQGYFFGYIFVDLILTI